MKAALRSALDLTQSTPNLIAMSLVQRDIGPYARFLKAIQRIDELVYQRIDEPQSGDSILDLLERLRSDERRAPGPARHAPRRPPRDQASALAWALERLARHPTDHTTDPDPFIAEVLRTRPVLSITARKTLKPYPSADTRCQKASMSRLCIYLANRRGRRSRGAAAPAAAWALRSPNWSCVRCYEP